MNRVYDTVFSALDASLAAIVRRTVEFLPNLLGSVIILAVGWIAAKLVEKLIPRILGTLGLDRASEGKGVTGVLREFGIGRSPVELAARLAFWAVTLLFLIPALEALQLVYVTQMIASVVLHLPNIVAACILLVIGIAATRFLARSAAASVSNAGFEYGPIAGLAVRYFLSLVVIILTLAQLGVQTNILTIVFMVIIVSMGLALALAIGLGSRAVVANVLAGAFLRDHFPAGREVQIHGIKGSVIKVGSVGTDIRKEDGQAFTVPNLVLMENVVE